MHQKIVDHEARELQMTAFSSSKMTLEMKAIHQDWTERQE